MKSLFYCLLFVACAMTVNAQTSVTVQWTATGDDGDAGTADRYEMAYSTDSTDLKAGFDFKDCESCMFVPNLPYPLIAGTVQEVIITGLTINTTYFVMMRVGDEIPNWSGKSNMIWFKLVDNTAPGLIVDFRVKP